MEATKGIQAKFYPSLIKSEPDDDGDGFSMSNWMREDTQSFKDKVDARDLHPDDLSQNKDNKLLQCDVSFRL